MLRDALSAHFDVSRENISVCTLAPDIISNLKMATIRFTELPPILGNLGAEKQLAIDVESLTPGEEILSMSIDENFLGMTVLSSPSSITSELVIVGVHDADGHAYTSFLNEKDGNMWLSDQLPGTYPNAWVITFGHTLALIRSKYHADLNCYITQLFCQLIHIFRHLPRRPVVFAGHGVGGILLKGALIMLHESSEFSFEPIKGALFVGVPSQGLDSHCFIPEYSDGIQSPLAEELRLGSSRLQTLNEEFLTVAKHYKLPIRHLHATQTSPVVSNEPFSIIYTMP
jgi:hypothetical protein